MRVSTRTLDKVKVRRGSDGAVIDPATTGDVQAVRDRLPSTLEGGRLQVAADGTEATGVTQETGAAGTKGLLSSLLKTARDVRDRLPSGGAATETTLADARDKLGTLVTQTDAVEGSLSSIDTKTPPLEVGRTPVALDGTEANGVSQDTGGAGSKGLLSSILNAVRAVRDRLPAALVGGRLDVNVGASALPSGASTEATLAGTKTATEAVRDRLPAALDSDAVKVREQNRPAANKLLTFDKDLGTVAASATALIGSSKRILWVVVDLYDGSDDGATLRVGASGENAATLLQLPKPMRVVLFDGDVSGDVYYTNPVAQSGKKLRVHVGVKE